MLEAPWVDSTISPSSPACAPPLPHTPEEAQSDGQEGGTSARTRLWQGAGRAGAQRWGMSGHGRASARPLASPEAGPGRGAPPPPRPEWAGRLGLRELGRGRASACLARAWRAPGTAAQDAAALPAPQSPRRAGSRRPRRKLREDARGGAGRAARAPGRPPPVRGPAQRSPGAGSPGRARARAMPR